MRNRKTGSTITMRVMCAIAFIIYTYLLAAGYQAPTLIFLQHILSDGQTQYDPWIGSAILTLVLMIVQFVVARLSHLPNMLHVLTYLPSMLILILLTDIDATPATELGGLGHVSMGLFAWIVPLLLIAYVFLVIIGRQWIPARNNIKAQGLSSGVWLFTIFMMVIMMGGVTLLANGDRSFHCRMKVERTIATDSYTPADTTLTLFRAIALSHRGSLADSLFYDPVAGSTASLSAFSGVHLYYISFDTLKRQVRSIQRSRQPHVAADYMMAGMLLDRDLDAFARTLPKYYTINDSLPQHYKEALVMYQHTRTNALTSYHNDVMEEDYHGIQDIFHRIGNNNAGKQEVLRQYKHSYWAYYLYR